MVSDRDAEREAARLAAWIKAEAAAAFDRLLELIADGVEAREAVATVQAGFDIAYAERLAAAFSAIMSRTVGAAEVLAMPVGDIVLSRRLYLHTQETAAQVTAVVRRHAAGVQQARELAMQLFDGYGPRDPDARPLEGRARAALPRELRDLTAGIADRQALARVFTRGRARAAALRTPALRAAYLEAFDAWAEGKGRDVLERKLKIAHLEKTRYMANRIAQTELARVQQEARGRELMADDAVEVVEVRLNPAHPRTDICDLYARADLYGLGPGRYPKPLAPRPPFHPFCWCRLRPRQDLVASEARKIPGGPEAAARAYLGAMPPAEAAAVLGSREKLEALLSGGQLPSVERIGALSPRSGP